MQSVSGRLRVVVLVSWLVQAGLFPISALGADSNLNWPPVPGASSGQCSADPLAPWGESCASKSTVSVQDDLGLTKVIILLTPPGRASYLQTQKAIQDLGGRITVGLPPEAILALIPPGAEKTLQSGHPNRVVATPAVNPVAPAGLNERQKLLLQNWNRRLYAKGAALPRPELPPPPHDALPRPPLAPGETLSVHPPLVLPQGLIPGDSISARNQSYEIFPAPTTTMTGVVAVTVFFPESSGAIDANLENWTAGQVSNVLAQIALGLDWWATMAPTSANLSFTALNYYDPATAACMQTSYEPITRSSWDEGLWMDQIMTCLGYASGGYLTKVDSFNTWYAGVAGAANAYSIWVVNDAADADNLFQDGYFAYAYLGGPLVVMTYDNDGYGISNMDAVLTHETGHTFYAYDEYYQAGYQICYCSDSSYGCPNLNCEHNCSFNLACLMKGDIPPFTNHDLCDCTRGQIGWACGCCDPTNFGKACEDGRFCTSSTVCTNGACGGGTPTCDDGNQCTTDICDEVGLTCSHVNSAGPCEDGKFCTVNDTCSSGVCQTGTPRNCDDGNSCTADSCNETAKQCDYLPLSGTTCGTGKVCKSGLCVPKSGGGGGGGGGGCALAPPDLTPQASAADSLIYYALLLMAGMAIKFLRRRRAAATPRSAPGV